VVARAAAALKKSAVLVTSRRDESKGTLPSKWIVLSDPAVLERSEWQVPLREPLPRATQLWTDDFSNVVNILK